MSDAIWVIDDDQAIRWVLERALKGADMTVTTFAEADSVLRALNHSRPDAVITDIRMKGTDGFALMRKIRELDARIPVIIMTAHSDLDSTVAAYEGGAFEYLPKPFDVDDAVDLVRRALDQPRPRQARPAEPPPEMPEIIGEAPAMQEVFRGIGRLARSTMTVLITGESGTGKELVAHALHRHSPRRERPFIALNTAAIPRDLLESELFGHERGAFTGATGARAGRFEQADDGTLFLDEIGDMPPDLQTRLLRVLAEGEFYRVGGTTAIRVDVRVIAATHQDLQALVDAGRLREDLYHRLNVIRIHTPALRERREDIPMLARHFLAQAAAELESPPKRLTAETEERLAQLDWPGNVRQLQNTCRWLMVMASGNEVHPGDLPDELVDERDADPAADWESALARWAEARLRSGESGVLDQAQPQFESVLVKAALRRTGGHRQEAARLLGWGRNTLTRKLKSLGLHHKDY